eukprot:6028356-Amphidinium_carterae.1
MGREPCARHTGYRNGSKSRMTSCACFVPNFFFRAEFIWEALRVFGVEGIRLRWFLVHKMRTNPRPPPNIMSIHQK